MPAGVDVFTAAGEELSSAASSNLHAAMKKSLAHFAAMNFTSLALLALLTQRVDAAALRMSTQLAPIGTDARRSRFRSSSAPPLYCAPTLPLHQAAASSLVQDDDVVLEVGCQLGETTRLLARAANVVGVDISRDLRSGASSSYRQFASPEAAELPSNVVLHLLDPRDDLLELQAVCAGRNVSVLVVDVNQIVGNDLPLELFALVRQVGRLFAPTIRAVLIKSRALSLLQHQLVPVLLSLCSHSSFAVAFHSA